MVQLRTQRTAFALYGVLLVLPTVALGYLQWHQIAQEKRDQLEQAPRDAEAAVLRFRGELERRLQRLIDAEDARPFDHYSAWYNPSENDITLLPSPLTADPRPTGILAWFAFDLIEREGASIDMFYGAEPNVRAGQGERLQSATQDLLQRFLADRELSAQARSRLEPAEYELPLRVLAANRASPDDEECLRAQRMLLLETRVPMITSPFHVQFFLEPDGAPRLVATRRVLANPLPQMVGLNECLHRFRRGLALVQGFFVDPEWYFHELPDQVAKSVLTPRERFLRASESVSEGGQEVIAQVSPIADLAIDTREPGERDHGLLRVVVDTADIEQRFRERAWRFASVMVMLALSLSTGFVLLWRSVASDLQQAQRTENFVAAVTHELRTPLASIKMHGEMLLDGWARDPKKQQEYYRRIVRETERLSTLVERVLEKARLASGPAAPAPGDLSSAVASLEEQLLRWGDSEHPDLAFDLAEDLPAVMLNHDAVRSIVINLVENARKYAPVEAARADTDPIRVVTRLEGQRVLLEVLDRGPGVPAEEREQIFQAFYRVGNEATRTARGTGLGLHLVALHAHSIGGHAEVLPRPGGGSIFRVSFRTAPADAA